MRSSVETTLARLAIRQIAGSRRSLWALVLAALPVLVSVLARMYADDADERLAMFVETFRNLIVPVLLPLVALVVGTGVFGNEVDDGTITYVLGKPVARWRIVVTRVVVSGLAAAAVVAPATLVSGLVAVGGLDPGGIVAASAIATIAGSLLYCALFVALSLSTRRALVAGLAYVVVWEGALSGAFAGTRLLSVRQYTLSFAEAVARGGDSLGGQLPAATALWMAAAVAVLATAWAVRRLRRFEIGEAA